LDELEELKITEKLVEKKNKSTMGLYKYFGAELKVTNLNLNMA
jgi:hypothetical protein